MKILFNIIGYIALSGAIFLMIAGIIYFHCYHLKPTALDVYQGKTTLKITYEDSIAVDTIVVFKDEFKK